MTELLNEFIESFIKHDNVKSYDDFVELSESVYQEVQDLPNAWLSQIITSIRRYPEDYVRELIEDTVILINPSDLTQFLNDTYAVSSSFGKCALIDALCFLEKLEALSFMVNLNVDDKEMEVSRLTSVVILEKQLKSKSIDKFLIEKYSLSWLPHSIKNEIYNCISDIYNIEIEMQSGHKDWLRQKNRHYSIQATKVAQNEFNNKRYKSVVKLLAPFEITGLSDLGKQLLKISRKKLERKNT